MTAQVRVLNRILGIRHRSEHPIREPEQASAVRLEARGRIRHRAHGTHVVCRGSKAVRQRLKARPPNARALSPRTNAAAAPTTPLPLRGPPLATTRLRHLL